MLSMSACSVFQFAAPPTTPAPFPPQPAPPPPPPPVSLELPSSDEARDEIWRWFLTHGYKEFQAQALLEHARTESGFNPCAAGPGGFHYTFQWGGLRLQQLQEFAHTSGCPQLHTQLAFADHELRDEPRFSCFWQATDEESAYAALRRGFGRGSC